MSVRSARTELKTIQVASAVNYRREIDGLRAIAVLPVMLFHAGFEAFSGGFVGVDIFFVISGYLITRIIVDELENGTFSIINFYERRARRILPALFLVMLVCLPFAWFWLYPSDMKEFLQSLVAVSVFASNIFFWRESGYFDTAAELKPLLHTWSLAVEEQYYALFPLFLILFWRLGKSWIIVTLGVLFVTSLILAYWGAYTKPASVFYLLPTRGWELLLGSFSAIYLSRPNQKQLGKTASEIGGFLGISLILYTVFSYQKSAPLTVLYAGLSSFGAVLVILFATYQTTVGKILGKKLLTGVGLISYSAYLWHQPVIAFARYRSSAKLSDLDLLGLLMASLVLAYGSWKFVETRFRKKHLFSRNFIFYFSLAGASFFISLGLVGYFYHDKLTSLRLNERQISTIESASSSPNRSWCHFPQTDEALKRKACAYFSTNTKVAVLGNSHGTELAYSLAYILKLKNIGVAHHTMSGCKHNYKIRGELGTVCGKWHSKVIEGLVADKHIGVVVLSYRNEEYLDELAYRKSLAEIANELAESGKRVVVVLQVPLPISHINQHLSRNMADLSGSIPSRKLSDWRGLYRHSGELRRLLRDDVAIFDPAELFCDNEWCYVTRNGIALYFDDNHISVAGGNVIAKELVRRYFSGV